MTLAEFVARWNGKGCDFDHAFGYQCVDPADQYLQDVWGVPVFYVTGAVDLYGHRPDLIEWIPNQVGNASQYPQPGDMVIWQLDHLVGTGVYGHVDIFVSGNGLAFTGLDQNWPVGSVCHLQAHNYEGVKGWGRLRKPPAAPPKPAPAPIPAAPVSAPPPVSPAPAPVPAAPPAPAPSPAPTHDPVPPPPPPPGAGWTWDGSAWVGGTPPPSTPAPAPKPAPTPEVPPVQNPPVVIPPLPPEVVPVPIPEPPAVAEAGIGTSEWSALVRYGVQAAGLVTAQLVNVVSESVWHVGVVVPQSVQLFVGGLELAGAIAVAGYAVSRGIRKLGTSS